MHRRDFYKFVGEKVVSTELFPRVNHITERDILKYVSMDGYGSTLNEDEIVIRKHTVNFAMGDKNPFERVKFYRPPNTKGKH
jgi:hypothetical protein